MPDLTGNGGPPASTASWHPAPEPDAVQILLVRHGRTAWNRERRFLGRTDVPLDEVGRHEAELLALRLARARVDAVVTSPLLRAAETAAALAAPHGIAPHSDELLVELSQGELEGQPGAVLFERYPEFLERWVQDPATARVPGGETLGECQARGLQALQAVAAAAAAGSTVAVVSHQMVIASVLCHVLDLPLRHHRLVGHENAAFSVLHFRSGRLELRRIHDREHLPPRLSGPARS